MMTTHFTVTFHPQKYFAKVLVPPHGQKVNRQFLQSGLIYYKFRFFFNIKDPLTKPFACHFLNWIVHILSKRKGNTYHWIRMLPPSFAYRSNAFENTISWKRQQPKHFTPEKHIHLHIQVHTYLIANKPVPCLSLTLLLCPSRIAIDIVVYRSGNQCHRWSLTRWNFNPCYPLPFHLESLRNQHL